LKNDVRDVIEELERKTLESEQKTRETQALVLLLDRWVKALAESYGNAIDWETINGLWRESHDVLSRYSA
jgi:hypothetical protein